MKKSLQSFALYFTFTANRVDKRQRSKGRLKTMKQRKKRKTMRQRKTLK